MSIYIYIHIYKEQEALFTVVPFLNSIVMDPFMSQKTVCMTFFTDH